MTYQNLVVNGCSYMELYAKGEGHVDLANRLGIDNAASLAIGGSANSRIIRTTLKHSYESPEYNFYVLGMTFLSRNEIPILTVDSDNDWEGPWTNPQNQDFKHQWQPNWTENDTDLYVEQKLKTEIYSTFYRYEDLQFRILSMVNDLKSRGHGVLVFQQADDLHLPFVDHNRFKFLFQCKNIVGGYKWRAVPWQHSQGVPVAYAGREIHHVPEEIKHRKAGEHTVLNQYLVDYIKFNSIVN
jgi:hypothetical protein